MLKNAFAWLTIQMSNLASFLGRGAIVILFLFVGGCLLAGIIRTLAAGREKASPLSSPDPDADLTARAAESLSRGIAINTVTGDAEGLSRFRAFLRSRYPLVFRFMEVLTAAPGTLVLRWRGKNNKELPTLFLGHMDVVPPGDGWGDEDPFSGEIDDEGFIHGRGAIDCKNVVIGILEAATSLLEEGYIPDKDIYIAFGHDEEAGGGEGAAEIASFFEKRGLKFAAVIDEGGPIYSDYLGREGFPAASIGVAEKGCTYFTLTASGKGGHSSVPPKHTAVGVLSEAICRLEASPPRPRLLGVVEENFKLAAPAMRFMHRFLVCNLPFTKHFLFHAFSRAETLNPLIRTTLACTQVSGSQAPNVLPGTATGVVNARILQGDSPMSIRRYISSLVKDLPVKLEPMLEIPASAVAPTDSDIYETLCRTLRKKFDSLRCFPSVLPITTDSRHYQNLCDNIFKFMPFVLSTSNYATMHNAGEKIPVRSLGLAVEVYRDLMRCI